MKRYTTLFFLGLITLFGLGLRIYKVDSVPNGFFCDEAATGYNAYTILETGKDEYGKPFPVFFYSFGNNRLPLPIYLTIPFVAIFGLNEFASRAASAFFGTLTIPVIYVLLSVLFPKKRFIGYLGAFFLAIAPWHIHFSRTAHEYIYLPFFAILGVTLFILSIKSRKTILLYASFTSFALGFYTYYPSYIVIPLTLGLAIILYFKEFIAFKKHGVLALLTFLVISLPLAIGFYNGRALTRWNDGVSILSKYKAPKDVIQKVAYSYALHFSPDFLFIKGDIDFPGQFITRHSVKGMGMLYWFELPLLVSALSYIAVKRGKSDLLVLGILLIHPLGNVLTSTVNPYAPRSILGSVSWPIISALGLSVLLDLHKKLKAIITIAFALTMTYFVSKYVYKYYQEYPLYSSGYYGWQAGPREIMKIFLNNKDNYDDLIIVGNLNAPYIFLKFYDPGSSCTDKCKIGTDVKTSYNRLRHQLYAIGFDKIRETPSNLTFTTKEVIYYPSKEPAFYIGELQQQKP